MSVNASYQPFSGTLTVKHCKEYVITDSCGYRLEPALQTTRFSCLYDFYYNLADNVRLHVASDGFQQEFYLTGLRNAIDLTGAGLQYFSYGIGDNTLFVYCDSQENGYTDSPSRAYYLDANSFLPPAPLRGLVQIPVNRTTVSILSGTGEACASIDLETIGNRYEFSFYLSGEYVCLRVFYYAFGALATRNDQKMYISGIETTPSTRKQFISGHTTSYVAIGHRGCGSCRKHKYSQASVAENTLESFTCAFNNGADYVETDCMMTADGHVVINHDFSIKRNGRLQPIYDMTENEFLGVDLRQENDFYVKPPQIPEHRCSLHYMLEQLDPECGINLEIKYPTPTCKTVENGYCSRTVFIAKILSVIAYHPHRRIYFSSFDLSVCWILSAVQNVYPVLFLHASSAIKIPCDDVNYSFDEVRKFYAGYQAAKSAGIHGMVLSKHDVSGNADDIANISQQFAIFSYGTERKDLQWIQKQQDLGVTGIIFDMVDY